ncbi:MAG: hypothetical protein ACRDJ5_05475 [Actinomycetota bacterium]
MVELRADPWMPTHGAGAEASFEDEGTSAVVDPEVETSDWSRPLAPPPGPEEAFCFVDGVMRIDLRVMARDGDRRAWGLLGSYAAGGVRCDGRAGFVAEDAGIGRVMVLGGRISAPPLTVTVGNAELSYEPRCLAGDLPASQREALQRLMLQAEQRVALRLSEDHLVFADGPLHLNSGPNAEVVGVVKRMVTAYLNGGHAALLGSLEPGQRTPLFALGNSVLDRYAWYLRLLPRHPAWHDLAGLVRCDVRMELGLERARAIADRVCCLLPAFAGRPGIDPRAPQNLTPVGALETRLKHRMGSATVVRRALQAHLSEALGHA